eukprot:scaffold18779_cov93-Cylindrotheca_fusiformis.AAC.1
MPRKSKRWRLIQQLRQILTKRLENRSYRILFEDIDEPDFFANAMDAVIALGLSNALKKRFIFRSNTYRRGNPDLIFEEDLNDEQNDNDDDPWLSDDEFLQKYRMSRKSFHRVLDLIKDHEIFKNKSRVEQKPVAYQLMTWLKYVGTEGSGSSNANQRSTFKIGYGTANVYRQRVTIALRSLSGTYVSWPNEDERQSIARSIFQNYDFPHCVGIADGTLFPLAFEPETEDAPDYSGRKYGYSLSTMIICDHKRRIRHYLAGYPGSAHDNRVFKATNLARYPINYFTEREYIIGDSAFENSRHMVSAFKKPKGESIPTSHEKFNEKMAKLRIISEHCIGILKGRFPWLRSIRMKIKEDKKYLRSILRMLDATIVLHNILIEFGEEEKEDWIDDDDFSDIDEADRAPYEEGDALNTAIPDGAPKDARRTRLMYYMEEHQYF